MAHALSLLRLALAAPLAWGLLRDADPRGLAALLALAIATDLLDGPVARWRGTAGPAGRLLDHGADCAFVTAGLAALAARGELTWLLPVLICAAFAEYALSARAPARPSALGRANGVLYFVPLVDAIAVRLGAEGLRTLHAVAWALCASTALSLALRLHRRASPAAPTKARSAEP